jgi:hypothetical protein
MKIISLDASACAASQAQLADLLLDALAYGPCLGFPATLARTAPGATGRTCAPMSPAARACCWRRPTRAC